MTTQWTPMTTNDYQRLSKAIKGYQRLSKTIKDYQRLSKTIKKTKNPHSFPLVHSLSTHSTPAIRMQTSYLPLFRGPPSHLTLYSCRKHSTPGLLNNPPFGIMNHNNNTWRETFLCHHSWKTFFLFATAGRHDKGLITKMWTHKFADVWQTNFVSCSLALVVDTFRKQSFVGIFFKSINLLVAPPFLKISKDEGMHWRTIAGVIIVNVKCSYSGSNLMCIF